MIILAITSSKNLDNDYHNRSLDGNPVHDTGETYKHSSHSERAASVKRSITISRQCFRPFNLPVASTNNYLLARKRNSASSILFIRSHFFII